jgi:hypothetical protein
MDGCIDNKIVEDYADAMAAIQVKYPQLIPHVKYMNNYFQSNILQSNILQSNILQSNILQSNILQSKECYEYFTKMFNQMLSEYQKKPPGSLGGSSKPRKKPAAKKHPSKPTKSTATRKN